jgi:hypothetical protein
MGTVSFLSVCLGAALVLPSVATSYIRQSDLPHEKWVSIDQNIEYLPIFSPQPQQRSLAQDDDVYPDTFYKTSPFVEGESEYDEYQQAWRYLGFMIDCYDGWVAGQDDDGSYDGGTVEGCQRYLLWAAYVDLEYQGGGIGEYQYYNPETRQWDSTSCGYVENSRCAKMDCHLENTHWSLLGLFKHRSYQDWMEQLFKHEGFCVWNSGQYQFMSNAREAWPQGCEAYQLDSGEYIYYDLKPISRGRMRIGLYTETTCMEEYTGNDVTAEDLLGNILMEAGSGDGSQDEATDDDYYTTSSLQQSYEMWDSIMSTWEICHPCVAYDLNNVGYNGGAQGSAYNTYTYGYDDDGNYYEQSDFDCYDDADYTNVNQCMKFMAKTEMNAFTFRDISLASTQGTLVDYVPLLGYTNQNKLHSGAYTFVTVSFLIVSLTVLAIGSFMAYKARRELARIPRQVQEPLFEQNSRGEMT